MLFQFREKIKTSVIPVFEDEENEAKCGGQQKSVDTAKIFDDLRAKKIIGSTS